MHTVIVIAVIIGAAVAGFAALMAMQPSWPLGDFRPGHVLRDRHFAQPPAVVLDAYRRAVALTPGVTVADAEPTVLYLEVRPGGTPHVDARPFVLRLTFVPALDGGTTVRTCAQRRGRRQPTGVHTTRAIEAAEADLRTRVIERGLAWRLAGLW